MARQNLAEFVHPGADCFIFLNMLDKQGFVGFSVQSKPSRICALLPDEIIELPGQDVTGTTTPAYLLNYAVFYKPEQIPLVFQRNRLVPKNMVDDQ